jgi:hypothetical protein
MRLRYTDGKLLLYRETYNVYSEIHANFRVMYEKYAQLFRFKVGGTCSYHFLKG